MTIERIHRIIARSLFANYLRILISLGKGYEGYVPDYIPPTTKTLKVAAHTRWFMVAWSLS